MVRRMGGKKTGWERTGMRGLPLTFLVLFSGGCQSLDEVINQSSFGSEHQASNIYAVKRLPNAHQRLQVAVMTPKGEGDQLEERFRELVLERLQATGRFAVEPPWGGTDLSLQVELLSRRPYPPQRIAMRMVLFAPGASEVLWAADEQFDAGHPSVARGARRYGNRRLQRGFPNRAGELVLLSPENFTRYALDSLFQTLPTIETGGSRQNPERFQTP